MPPEAPPSSSPLIERWSLRLHLARPLHHAEHAGSMLRGSFGHALKALACRCGNEAHQSECTYQQIFEPLGPAGWPDRYRDCPPAYVLSPPPDVRGANEPLDFALTLLGPAVAHRALIWQAWQQAASKGLGESRIPARLQALTAGSLPNTRPGTRRVRLQLTSPLLLKRKRPGQSASQPLRPHEVDSTDLLLALHRRLELTQRLYRAPDQPLPPLKQWLALGDALTLDSNLQDTHFARRSSRQRQRMPLYGLTGTLDLSGPLPPDLLAALTIGQWLHIGGKTALGLGGYRLLSDPDSTFDDGKSMP